MNAWPQRFSSLSPELSPLLRIAAVFGLVTGLLEGLFWLVINSMPDGPTWKMRQNNVSSEILWIAPVVYLISFVFLGLVLAIFERWRHRFNLFPRLTTEAVGVFLFTALCIYALTRVPGRLYGWASYLLSIGVAWQVSRWSLLKPGTTLNLVRRGLPVLVILVILAVAATSGFKNVRKGVLINQLPPAATDSPNVILIVLDSVRADHLSSYGYDRPTTPNIDAFAREGVQFKNAIATSSWTPPTHASLMTGRPVHEHGTDSEKPLLDETYPTIAEVLSSQGYVTAGFSANTYWITSVSGFESWIPPL